MLLLDCINNGGARRDRTDDLLRARQALSQLSYGPIEGYLAYFCSDWTSEKAKRVTTRESLQKFKLD